MSERAMMSDRAGRSAIFMDWSAHVNSESRARAAEREARRILAETEREDAEDGLGDAILGWPYQDTPTALRNAMAESLARFCALASLEDLK